VPQRIYSFRACRCFRKDSRRVISALAARTASAIVGFCFCSGVLFTPTYGSVGRTWVDNIEGRSIGCVIIGPIAGLFLGILENAFLAISLKHATRPCRDKPCVTSANAVTIPATAANDHEIKLLLSSGCIRRICAGETSLST
jgi:hypothetical protein